MRAAIVVAALFACPACVDIVGAHLEGRYVEREDKRFTTGAKPEVVLATFDGSIEVRAWDKSEVEVTIEKRGADKSAVSEIEVSASQTGNHIAVEAKMPRRRFGLQLGPSPTAKLIVSVPFSSDVAARSGDGSIDLERVAGKVELRSGDGSIRARDLAGDVTVQTGDGSIALDGKFSTLFARSGDGNVKIHATAGSATNGDWDISTGDGTVTLEVPEGFGGELDAHTGDGRVEVDDLTVSNVTGEMRRNSVRGRLGSGGHAIRVRSGDGTITLKKAS